MFGDWDYKSMEKVGRVSAGVWFWIFMFMIVMVMFNVLLAIIIETYTEVKKTAQNAESLIKTVTTMHRRRKQTKQGKRVKLNDVMAAIVKEQKEHGLTEDEIFDSERLLTASFLQSLIEKIPYEQAQRTLANAQTEFDKETDEPLELSEAHENLLGLNEKAETMRRDLFDTYAVVDHYDTMATKEDLEYKQNEEKAEETAEREAALAAELAQALEASATANESPVSQEVLDGVSKEVGRLTSEVASVLAQTMKKVDRKQNYLEVRQKEMLGSIREMQTKLQMSQSEAAGLTTRLQRILHNQSKAPNRGGVVLPSCLTFDAHNLSSEKAGS
jgi:hypothetical protein